MRTRVLALSVSSALMSCSGGHTTVRAELPSWVEDSDSVFIAHLSDDESSPPRVWAYDLAAEGQINDAPRIDEFETGSLYLLRTKARLSLLIGERGALSGANGVELGARLDEFDAFSATVDEVEVGPWLPTDRPEALSRFLVSPPPCIDYEGRTHMLGPNGETSQGQFAVGIDDQSALVGTSRRRFFAVHVAEDFSSRIEPVPALDDVAPHRAGWRDDDGYLWLVGDRGAIVRVDPRDGFAIDARPGAPTNADLDRIDGLGAEPDLSLFALSDAGEVLHFDGQSWTMLHDGPSHYNTAVTAIASDEVLVAVGNQTALTRIKAGVVTTEQPEAGQIERIGAVRHIANVGTVASTEGTGLSYFRDAQGWRSLPINPSPGRPNALGFRAYDIAATPHGYVLAGGSGAVLQYIPRAGFCPSLSNSANAITVSSIAAFGEHLVGVTDPSAESPIRTALAVVLSPPK